MPKTCNPNPEIIVRGSIKQIRRVKESKEVQIRRQSIAGIKNKAIP
jgi:hypothetical protein